MKALAYFFVSSRYTALCQTGEIGKLPDLSTIIVVDDLEVHDAIRNLESSTAEIEKQARTLQIQQNAVNKIVENNMTNHAARTTINVAQFETWTMEIDRLMSAVGPNFGRVMSQCLITIRMTSF